MFNPQAHFQVDGENNLMALDQVNTEHFASIVLFVSNIMLLGTIIFVSYLLSLFYNIQKVSFFIGRYLWNMLTPGNQLLELTALVSGVVICGTAFWFINDVIDKIDIKIRDLKEDSRRKTKIIEQMELEIITLKTYYNIQYKELCEEKMNKKNKNKYI